MTATHTTLSKLRLDGWWPDKPTPASLELLSGYFRNQWSVLDVVPESSEASKSRLLLCCEALNHIWEYVIFDPQAPNLRTVAAPHINLPRDEIDEIWPSGVNGL